MAKDDFEVIEYKILKLIYEFMKTGRKVTLKDIAYKSEIIDINREYWIFIIKEMIENNFICGLKYVEIKDMQCIIETGNIIVTRVGREYLIDNNIMHKVQEILGDTFKVTLGSILGKL